MAFVRNNGLLLYLFVLAAQCLAIYAGWENLRVITKILLVPMLMLQLFAVAGSLVPAIVYIGLLFAYLGDLALLKNENSFFLAGMACFVISHICYSLYFLRAHDPGHGRLREAFAAAVILMLISAFMFGMLNPYLGSLRIPVLVYMAIISIMSILAANTAGTSLRSIALTCFIPGAAFFVLSDASLALNKFVFHVWWLNLVVMFTYGIAQFLLARGFGRVALRF